MLSQAKLLLVNVSAMCPVRIMSVKWVAMALFSVLAYATLKVEMFAPDGAFESASLVEAWDSPSLSGSPALLYAHLHGVPLFEVLVTAVWHASRVSVVGSRLLPNIRAL